MQLLPELELFGHFYSAKKKRKGGGVGRRKEQSPFFHLSLSLSLSFVEKKKGTEWSAIDNADVGINLVAHPPIDPPLARAYARLE